MFRVFSSKNILGVFLFLAIISLVVPASACGSKNETAKSVKVGIILPSTGVFAAYGPVIKPGIQYVLDQITAAGGIQSLGGASVDVVWGDDQSTTDGAQAETERLMTQEGVKVLIGPVLNAVSAAPLADRYKIPMMSLFSNQPAIQDLKLNYWRNLNPEINPGDWGTAFVNFMKYLADNFGVKDTRIALVNTDTDGGHYAHDQEIARLTALGLQNKVVYDAYSNPGAADVTPLALQAKAANPDIMIGMLPPQDGALWFVAMASNGFFPATWITDGMVGEASFRQQITPGLFDAVASKVNIFGLPTFAPTIGIPTCQDAAAKIAAYCQANSAYFSEGAMLGAQAMYVIWDALEKAGSTDPVKINDALNTLSIPESSPHFIIPVFAPELAFQKYGHMKNYTPIGAQLQNGAQVVVWPVAVKLGDPILH